MWDAYNGRKLPRGYCNQVGESLSTAVLRNPVSTSPALPASNGDLVDCRWTDLAHSVRSHFCSGADRCTPVTQSACRAFIPRTYESPIHTEMRCHLSSLSASKQPSDSFGLLTTFIRDGEKGFLVPIRPGLRPWRALSHDEASSDRQRALLIDEYSLDPS